MSPGVPYVSVRSNDVLNGSLDLVLRLCTRVDAVWRVLRPDREVDTFLLDPLLLHTKTGNFFSRGALPRTPPGCRPGPRVEGENLLSTSPTTLPLPTA